MYYINMKFLEKLDIKQETKTYIAGVIFFVITLFILSSVSFIWIATDKLDILFSQKAEVVCTYFASIMDRILFVMIILWLLPITIMQFAAKNKSKTDKITLLEAVLILIALLTIFAGGEYHFYKIYKSGELTNSELFSKPTLEMKIFDKI